MSNKDISVFINYVNTKYLYEHTHLNVTIFLCNEIHYLSVNNILRLRDKCDNDKIKHHNKNDCIIIAYAVDN